MTPRRRNLLLVALAVIAIVLLGLFAAHPGGGPLAVRMARVTRGNFQTTLPESGVVQMPRVVVLPAAVTGTLGQILVRPGDRVAAGTLLATIYNDQLTSSLHDAEDSALAAAAHVQTVTAQNAALPEQNHSSIVQAQAAVVAAKSALTQAQGDLVSGQQSGLGYTSDSAQAQRIAADATLARAKTELDEADRLYGADLALYAQRGLSKDALDQARDRRDEAQVAFDQAHGERAILDSTLVREHDVLEDRVQSARDALRQAQAALAAAQANALASKTGDLAGAKADAARAQADLAFAREQVAHLEIRAPFAGIVQRVATQPNDPLRTLEPGDAVTLGQALVTLAEGNRYVVRTKVDEQDVSQIALGQRAIVGGEDFGTKKLGGRIVAISPVAIRSEDPADTAREIPATIALDDNLPFLRDGLSVDVDIVTHDLPGVLLVPIDALRSDAKGSYVFAVVHGHAVRTKVTLGPENDTRAVVRSGVSAGTQVVDDQTALVAEGAAVS
ncbi:MAG: efflux RND transporter periplasmic adaptor subunit, partial [Vulcanimicrobiaceae bacterium]